MAYQFTHVRFHPRVGEHYSSSPSGLKLLVLGESHYRWEGQPRKESETTTQALEGGRGKGRFWVRVSGLLNKQKAKSANDVWDYVTFYNYVQHFVGDRARQRPEERMWTSPDTINAFKEVLTVCKPDRVLVLEKTNWRNMAGEKELADHPPRIEKKFQLPTDFTKHLDSKN